MRPRPAAASAPIEPPGRMRLFYIAHMRLPTRRAHSHQIMQMCEAFADEGCEVTLVCGRRPHRDGRQAPDPWEAYGVKHNFRIEAMPSLDMAALSPRLLRPFRPTLLRFLWALSLFLFTLAAVLRLHREGRAVFYTRDALPLWVIARLFPRRADRLFFEAHTCPIRWPGTWLRRDLANRIGGMVFVTANLRERYRERGISPESALVAHDGVRLARFAIDGDRTDWRKELGWPVEAFMAGYAGRLEVLGMAKGVMDLAKAAIQLYREEGALPFYLAIIGPSADELAEVRSISLTLGLPPRRLLTPGWMPPARLPGILRALDACAIPFPWTEHLAYDASPLKLFEYMASGTPIVASDLPAIAEVLHHEKNALLVPPGDIEALAAALRRFRGDPPLANRLAVQAALDAQSCGWDTRANLILEMIRRSGSQAGH